MISPDGVPRRQRNSIPKRLSYKMLHENDQIGTGGPSQRLDRRGSRKVVSASAPHAVEDPGDVILCFGEGRKPPIAANRRFARVVGSQGEANLKPAEQVLEV